MCMYPCDDVMTGHHLPSPLYHRHVHTMSVREVTFTFSARHRKHPPPPAHTCQPRVECYGCLCAVETIPFCNIVGLQQGQEEILQRQEVIQCGQKRQVVVTEEVLARVQGLERGQEYISRQLEPKGTVTGRSVCIVVG